VGIEVSEKKKDLLIPKPKHYSFAVLNKKQLKAENVMVEEVMKKKKPVRIVKIINPEKPIEASYKEPLAKNKSKPKRKELCKGKQTNTFRGKIDFSNVTALVKNTKSKLTKNVKGDKAKEKSAFSDKTKKRKKGQSRSDKPC